MEIATMLSELAESEPLKLPFAWRDLPRRPCERGGYSAIGTLARWSTLLDDGREVHLTALHQYRTYGGVLCGFPDCDEVRGWPIEGAVRCADELFQCEPSRVAILPPELMVSLVPSRPGQPDRSIEFLPAVCCVATLQSPEPSFDPHALASEVVVVWFQQAFGPPEPGHVTRSIQAIDWDEYASDWFS